MKSTISFLTILALFSCSDQKEFRLQQLLLKGNGALKERNTEQAANYYQEAINMEPCFTDALNNLGTIRFQQQHFEEALDLYNKAAGCNPKFLPAYFNRANTYYELKQYYNASQDVEQLLKQKPDTAVAWFLRGLIASAMHDMPVALESFDKAVSLDNSNVEYLVNRGTVKYYLRLYDEAEMDLQKARQINPKESNIYNALSQVEADRNHLGKALEYINQALVLSPDQPYYLNNRGYILLMSNRLDEAVQDIDRSMVLDHSNGWVYRNKGVYCLLKGDFSRAVKLLNQAVEMDGFIARIHFYLGMAYLNTKETKKACLEFDLSEQAGDKMVTPEILKVCP